MRNTATILVWAVLAAACGGSTGPAGPRGEPGATGATGAPGAGPTGQRLVHVDANGTEVNGGTFYVDARGFEWPLDAETATLQISVTSIYYLGAGCPGQGYIIPPLPRFPFKVIGESQWRVRDDTERDTISGFGSVKNGSGSCSTTSTGELGMPLDDSTIPSPPIEDPIIPYVPPLHLELR